MKAATVAEQFALAASAGTTRAYLYQIAAGARSPGADLAGRIEEAAEALRRQSKGRLPALTRGDLSAACGACPYLAKCLN